MYLKLEETLTFYYLDVKHLRIYKKSKKKVVDFFYKLQYTIIVPRDGTSRELLRYRNKTHGRQKRVSLNKVKMCEKNFMKPLDKLQNP